MDVNKFKNVIAQYPWLRPMLLDRGDESLVNDWITNRLRFIEVQSWVKLKSTHVKSKLCAYNYEPIQDLHAFLYFKMVKYGVIYHLAGESPGKCAMLAKSGESSLNVQQIIDLLMSKDSDSKEPIIKEASEKKCQVYIDAVMEITEHACLTGVYTESIIVYSSPVLLLNKKG